MCLFHHTNASVLSQYGSISQFIPTPRLADAIIPVCHNKRIIRNKVFRNPSIPPCRENPRIRSPSITHALPPMRKSDVPYL